MYNITSLPKLKLLSVNAMRHVTILLVLLVAFSFNFAHHDGWKDAQGPGDEPAYIDGAYNLWHTGAVFGAITWSPGYVVLMSPVVGMFGKETGYKIWRFALFAGVSSLVFVAFARMFNSTWLGAVLAVYSQMFWMPYASPSLQALVCLLYLICFFLLPDKTRFLGFVFAILLNGILVSGTVGPVIFSFGALCMLFYPRLIFSKRFLAQFLVGLAIFWTILHHFNYDIRKYPEEASLRGRAGLYHQLSLYILSSGRSIPYLAPGEDDTKLNNLDEYHRHLNAIDRYYVDKFGETEGALKAISHDKQWPQFLLDWPWMMTKDPELMKEYAQDVLRTLGGSAWTSFEIILPFGNYDINTRSLKRGMYVIPLIFVLLLPQLIGLTKKKPLAPSSHTWPSRLQILFFLSCLSSLVPLVLTKPLSIYFPPLIPAYLMGVALFTLWLLRRSRKVAPASGEVDRTS